jgi:hypothetical protein
VDQAKREFLEQNYSNYRELCDYDVFALIKHLSEMEDNIPAVQIAIRLQQRTMPKILRLDSADLKKVNAELKSFKQQHTADFQDWQLMLITTPHQSYSGEEDPILVTNELGEINPIGEFSLMLDAISDRLETIAFLSIDKMIADDPRIVKLSKSLFGVERRRHTA